MYLIGAFTGRQNFGPFLASLGLNRRTVEVGTHRGGFARVLLASWPGVLTCVDPWSVPPGYTGQAKGLHLSDGDREADYAAARAALDEFGSRVEFRRELSAGAAPTFADASLDFVYLDGDHSPSHVVADLRMWWPKVRSGGVLAGHDIISLPGVDNWGLSVQTSVSSFAFRECVDVNLVVEENGDPWSWYVVRP